MFRARKRDAAGQILLWSPGRHGVQLGQYYVTWLKMPDRMHMSSSEASWVIESRYVDSRNADVHEHVSEMFYQAVHT